MVGTIGSPFGVRLLDCVCGVDDDGGYDPYELSSDGHWTGWIKRCLFVPYMESGRRNGYPFGSSRDVSRSNLHKSLPGLGLLRVP